MQTPTRATPDVPEVEGTPSAPAAQPAQVRARIATGTAPPPRPVPQRRSNTVEEVIESGEIVERRSLVIRSQSLPAIDWSDEATEITAIPARPPTRNRSVVWLVAAGVCGVAAAVALALVARSDAATLAALEPAAEMIGTTLEGEARAAMLRAEAFATSPALRAGIETDANTLADMARDQDLAFTLQRGDVVEVFQIRDGARTLMLRLPAVDPVRNPPTVGQTHVDVRDHRVVVVATTAVANQRSAIAGQIVLSTPVDLAPVARRVSEHASGAVLEGLGEPVALVNGAATATVRIPIRARAPITGALSLAAVVPQPTLQRSFAWAAIAASLLLLAIYAASVLRTRRRRIA